MILLLRASCLTLEINKFRCYEVKIEESEKAGSHRESTQDTSGLSCQCSATEPQQPDKHQWLPGVRLRHSVPPVQYIQGIVRAGGCPAVVDQWQSTGRALAAQARGVLGLTPGDCRLFHFPLFSPHNI